MTGRSRFWDGCRKAVQVLLFLLLLPMSAYIFYGALDTLKYADALQKMLHGKMVLLFLLGTAFLLCLLFAGVFRKAASCLEKHWNTAVPALFGLMILLQVLMVLMVRTSLRQDI